MRDLNALPTAELEALRDNYAAAMEGLVVPPGGVPCVGVVLGRQTHGVAVNQLAVVTAPALILARVKEINNIIRSRRDQ